MSLISSFYNFHNSIFTFLIVVLSFWSDVMPATQKVSKENIFEEVEQSKDVRKENHFPKQNITDIKNDPDDARDPGVPDEIWRQLQLAKIVAKEEEQKKELKKEEEKRYSR